LATAILMIEGIAKKEMIKAVIKLGIMSNMSVTA
jgi:hypothetical protein